MYTIIKISWSFSCLSSEGLVLMWCDLTIIVLRIDRRQNPCVTRIREILFPQIRIREFVIWSVFACWYGVANWYIKKKRKDARESTTVLSVCVTETIIRISPWVYESLKKKPIVFIVRFSTKIRLARFKSSAFPARASLPSCWKRSSASSARDCLTQFNNCRLDTK